MACECNIGTIERECGQNAAGVKPTLYVTCEEQVATIGAATDHAVSTITMKAAAAPDPAGKFFKWYGSRRLGEYKSTQNEESGAWETEAKYFLPKMTSAKSAILNALGVDNSIAIITDMNGSQRIVGELDNPCNVFTEGSANGTNGYTVTIKWTSAHEPYFFTGTPQV